MTRKTALVAVVAMLALGTSAALALGAGPHATSAPETAQETAIDAQEDTPTEEAANVTVENQTSNGSAVVVQEVTVPEGGFVVIHAANETEDEFSENETQFEGANETELEDAPAANDTAQQYTAGEVLGNSTYLEAGTHENVSVALNRTLNESQVLIAMPHQDTNDNQRYEFPEADNPYTADGQPVTDWANVTLEGAGNETTPDGGGETTTEEA